MRLVKLVMIIRRCDRLICLYSEFSFQLERESIYLLRRKPQTLAQIFFSWLKPQLKLAQLFLSALGVGHALQLPSQSVAEVFGLLGFLRFWFFFGFLRFWFAVWFAVWWWFWAGAGKRRDWLRRDLRWWLLQVKIKQATASVDVLGTTKYAWSGSGRRWWWCLNRIAQKKYKRIMGNPGLKLAIKFKTGL